MRTIRRSADYAERMARKAEQDRALEQFGWWFVGAVSTCMTIFAGFAVAFGPERNQAFFAITGVCWLAAVCVAAANYNQCRR